MEGICEAADGTPIHFQVRGRGFPVYVCHGGPHATYTYLQEALRPLEERFTLVYHDYRGSGRSGTAPPETYRFERLAADLEALRSMLGHDRPALLAHSLGGFVALHYALRHPDRVDRLILVATTPCGSIGRMLWPTLRALGPSRLARIVLHGMVYAVRWAWRAESAERRRARYRVMALLQEGRPETRTLVRTAEAAARTFSDNAARLEAEAYRSDLTPRLREISCPVLLMCGSRDAVFYGALRLYRSQWQSARLVVLPGVGHHPAIEEPEAFLREVAAFLEPA